MITKKIIILIVVIIVLVAGYYFISPFFINIKMDEALPVGGGPASDLATTSERAEVVGTAGHPASGYALVVEAEGKKYVRYEDFKTINGPDIYVYLAKDLEAKEFVSLGKVKATEGNVNYEIPAGVNVSEYPYVLTWCKTFGVLFNHAKLI
ncbi:MAG: DM13 domain-containing protein [Candidatus Pacebacteria bacterium]|nr:DM13 domain-containing protein [Candidatus Paceibacterota bacterium]